MDDATADASPKFSTSNNRVGASIGHYRRHTTVLSGKTKAKDIGECSIGGQNDAISMISDGVKHPNTHTTITSSRSLYERASDSMPGHIYRRHVRYNHSVTKPLGHSARVGFSILNLTGQPLRYVQNISFAYATEVQYLEHNQRGLLNFVASKTSIRNNQIVEEQFGHLKQEFLQRRGQQEIFNDKRRSKEVGHHIAVQVCGYKWLSSLQADALGIHFRDLTAVLGALNASSVANATNKRRVSGVSAGTEDIDRPETVVDWKTANALKLVAEVRSHYGGRMLVLRSPFTVRNSTTHDINIVANFTRVMPDAPQGNRSDHFSLQSGESFFIPLALINESVLRSHGKNGRGNTEFGSLWLRPRTLKAVRSELGPASQFVKSISYSGDPIILRDVLGGVEQLQTSTEERNAGASITAASTLNRTESSFLTDGSHKQLSCTLSTRIADGRGEMFENEDTNVCYGNSSDAKEDDIYGLMSTPIVNSDKLPSFCYNIEVKVSGSTSFMGQQDQDRASGRFMSMFSSNRPSHDDMSRSPLQYTIGKPTDQ